MIYIGTSGYSFKDWVGPFYPGKTRAPDMLKIYAERFPTVELNFTYYAMPAEKTIAGMAGNTPEDFQFFVKANQATTHEQDRSAAEPFLAALEPFRTTGKLAGILAQFPYAFKNNEVSRRYLAELREDFTDESVVVEFRHDSWTRDPVFDFLERLQFGYCAVDEPDLPGLVPPVARATASTAYVRFHSRDASKWFGGDGQERYNYLYSEDELREWTPKVQELNAEPKVDNLFVFFNNCHAGHAAVNAVQFQEMLRELGLL